MCGSQWLRRNATAILAEYLILAHFYFKVRVVFQSKRLKVPSIPVRAKCQLCYINAALSSILILIVSFEHRTLNLYTSGQFHCLTHVFIKCVIVDCLATWVQQKQTIIW